MTVLKRARGRSREIEDMNNTYLRHFYWVDEAEADALTRDLREKKVKVRMAKGVVCVALDAINQVAVVAPEVWSATCFRQGGWYRSSDLNGKYLVVSAFELEACAHRKAGKIMTSDFRPPRLATSEEKMALVEDPEIRKRLPPEWSKIDDREKRLYLRWARRLGSDTQDYDLLHLTHTANHGNFLKPRLFIREEGRIIPYSLDRSAHLCSCCVEIFGLLDSGYDPLLVAPCPGATLFADLEPDRYLRVEKASIP